MTISPPAGLLGAQTPRVEHTPLFHTSAADDAVELAASVGLYLDPWQEHVLRGSLGEKQDGKWSAFEVALMVPRQNGKGSVLEARELAGLFLFGEMVIIHSAHEFRTAIEGFKRVESLIRHSYLVEDVKGFKGDPLGQMSGIKTGNGAEGIELKSGQTLRFMARTTGSGRGFTGDCIILDEAYALKPGQVDAMLPTMAARSVTGSPQIWYTSSAGMPESEVLEGLRERGMSGDAGALYYAEWSVDEKAEGFDPADPEQWAIANPALGIRISEEYISSEYRSMGAEGFARERLGIWAQVGGQSVFPAGSWDACKDANSEAGDVLALSIDVPPDRSSATIGLAAFREDGRFHAEVIDRRPGLDWVAPALETLAGKLKPVAIALDGGGAAAVLIPELREHRIRTVQATARQYGQACGAFFDLAMQGALVHIGQAELDAAVEASRRAPMGETLWKWSRKDSLSDISPLCAVTLAVHGLNLRGRRRRKTAQSGRKVLIL